MTGANAHTHDLVQAVRPFARESRWRSWWFVATTMVSAFGMLAIAAMAPWWPAQLAAALFGAALLLRGFMLYHDFMHHAILRDSWVAGAIMHLYGWLLLVPARSWRASHDYHHAQVGNLAESHVGSFPLMTVAQWRAAGFWRRLHYRFARSPWCLLLAYVTVFLFSITIEPFLRRPLRYWDSPIALAVHGGAIVLLWWLGGFWAAFFAVILPFAVSAAMGAYLFYAQHNWPGMRVVEPDEWSMHRGAVESASYMQLGPVLRWITGNIGFHHVHHLNAAIPFYRLQEATRALRLPTAPVVTTLRPRDVWACLRLKLWDPVAGRMVGFGAARRAAA